MEEIKVGEYVRYADGCICKITKNFKNYDLETATILKHSPNIIDLIEEGDYVNGDKIVAIDYTEDEDGNYKNVLGIMEIEDDYAYPIELRVINIKSIVTKEMFNQVKYEV